MIDEKDIQKLIKKAQKRKGRFSKRIVTLVILLNVIFTSVVLYVFFRTGNEPMTLVSAWFGFTTIELWSLSKIKRDEIKEGDIDEYRDYS